MCARIPELGKEDGGRLGFAEYLNVEADVQTAYADVESEITDSVSGGDNGDDNEPTRAPALAVVVDSVSIVRSFVECSGGDFNMLRVVSQLENMALGTVNYRAMQSRINDYFK